VGAVPLDLTLSVPVRSAENLTLSGIAAADGVDCWGMRIPRTLIPVLALGAASLAFIGVSAALEDEGSPPPDDSTTIPAPDCTTTDTELDGLEPCESTDSTDVVDDEGVVDDEVEVDADADADEVEGDGTETDGDEGWANHGAAVSDAAHNCPPGPEHGACVSEVARSDAGKPAHAQKDAEVDEGEETDVVKTEDEVGPAAPAKDHEGKGAQGKGRGRG
jgi:hypothetical protein